MTPKKFIHAFGALWRFFQEHSFIVTYNFHCAKIWIGFFVLFLIISHLEIILYRIMSEWGWSGVIGKIWFHFLVQCLHCMEGRMIRAGLCLMMWSLAESDTDYLDNLCRISLIVMFPDMIWFGLSDFLSSDCIIIQASYPSCASVVFGEFPWFSYWVGEDGDHFSRILKLFILRSFGSALHPLLTLSESLGDLPNTSPAILSG